MNGRGNEPYISKPRFNFLFIIFMSEEQAKIKHVVTSPPHTELVKHFENISVFFFFVDSRNPLNIS